MRFTKMQGAGNDYIYIDARELDEDWPSLSLKMSDRHFGIGSDGIILVQNSDVADLKMRMFNADGSEGEMCGNGIRCFTKFAIERGIVNRPQKALNVDTLAGVRQVAPVYQGDRVTGARVAMGMPEFEPQQIPIKLNEPSVQVPVLEHPVHFGESCLLMSFVSMGNPHAVAFIDQSVDEFPLADIGPMIEHHSMFPRRVNFEIVNQANKGRLDARVWERGSGETMACGTGACGIAVVSRLLGYTQDKVDITLPGGTLSIEWDGEGEVYLEGPAEEVFSGDWN